MTIRVRLGADQLDADAPEHEVNLAYFWIRICVFLVLIPSNSVVHPDLDRSITIIYSAW